MPDTGVVMVETVDYRAGVSPGPNRERARVALVRGSPASSALGLYMPLLRRLRYGFLLFTILSFLPLVSAIIRGSTPGVLGVNVLAIVFHGSMAAVLWLRPPGLLWGLRLAELIGLGWFVGWAVWWGSGGGYAFFLLGEPGPETEAGSIRLHLFVTISQLVWFSILVAYSIIIPNTLRRCALVCGLVAACPLIAFAAQAFWLRPIDPSAALRILIELVWYAAFGLALVVFGAYRVEVLRRQANEARRFGQYRLGERLGVGGMGEVYRAEHDLLSRPCALKLILPERAVDSQYRRRFEREVQVLATLSHPNTVQVFDYGRADDGTFYFVMEYLPGMTLEQLVGRHGVLRPSRTIHFLRQICGALHEAHSRGLIHRDIKPSNVMVCERGGVHDVAKLLDFGLVTRPQNKPEGEELTQEGVVAGTPSYMSPEQIDQGADVDPRSDIYSVGALAYFLLTGQPPFAGRSRAKVLAAHLYEQPSAPSLHRADLPEDLEAIVLRCLAKAPADRYPNTKDVGAALERCRKAEEWTPDAAAVWWAELRSPESPVSLTCGCSGPATRAAEPNR